ncbi:unnamed protein product [Rotaria magnacalcarata]|uniref:RING-type domain-containing protein n=1 Tax=Rotaria magnacalcarata TaxID=392030 RepID=A0A816VKI8_9BILA|nr:unnamed protein product [Rotaria magnacalcarata]CAF4177458.1 unnamed protein product [Rotaria magnacalcarata]
MTEDTGHISESDSHVSWNALSVLDIKECTQSQFLEVLMNLDEICTSQSADERTTFIEHVYRRMLHTISLMTNISLDRIVAVIKQLITYSPVMTILTVDDLKNMNIEMEKRSVIIHFDMSGSMSTSGFGPLVNSLKHLCKSLHDQGIDVYVSLFGGSTQGVHAALGGRLLTSEEFKNGDYRPDGGTAFCPSFERTKLFPTAYDAIIISDGEFTDDVSLLTFQEHCQTVFFVAPPWSPLGIEKKHARTISPCVKPNVPYIGIASDEYPQLECIINRFLRENNTFAQLTGFVTIGTFVLPSSILAPTRMRQIFINAVAQGETQLQALTRKIIGLFRYLEETAKLNFERCIRGEDFRNLMSLVNPLIRSAQAHLETSVACQQLYGYLDKIVSSFAIEKKKLLKNNAHDPKFTAELQKFWDHAMTYSERECIIEENTRRYGQPIGFLNIHTDRLMCTGEILSEALQQLRRLYVLESPDSLSLVFELLSMSTIDDQPTPGPEDSRILIWKKPDGIVDLLSILRQLPFCLQQYQYGKNISQDRPWTLQPMAATRLAWVMDVSHRSFPDFILQSLPTLVKPCKFLTDLDRDENREVFWAKIIRELAPKIDLSIENLQLVNQILIVYGIKNFIMRLYDRSITYERPLYENALPYIDTDEPTAWCIFVNKMGERVDPRTGEVTTQSRLITDPNQIESWYRANLTAHGSLVRPRYLTRIEFPLLPDDAIELYQTSNQKDTDLLRNQLFELYGSSYSSDQINAHINTIRDQFKAVPHVIWGSTNLITNTVVSIKEACQNAPIIIEKVIIDVTRSNVINYLCSHCDDLFISGALTGFATYSTMASQEGGATISKFDYAVECGQKAILEPTIIQNVRIHHLDQSSVQQYMKQKYKQLMQSIRLMAQPPQFSSLSDLLHKTQLTTTIDRGFLSAVTTENESQTRLNKTLFTCPITLDIMENPAITTPCGHMFDMSAITEYLKTINNICPVCRTTVTDVTHNDAFKTVIEAWLSHQTE